MKTKTSHGVRSPMHGFTPPIHTPSLTGAGGGTVIPGSAPGKGTKIQSPNNGPKNVGK